MARWLFAASLTLLSGLASAGTDNFTSVPEPETLALLAVGAIALVIARARRRK